MVAMGILHLATLAGLIVLYCRHIGLPWREWPLMVFLLLWASLVLAGYLLSPFDALNYLPAYIIANLIGLVLVLIGHNSVFAPARATPYGKISYPAFDEIINADRRHLLKWLLLGTLGAALIIHLIICFSFYPVNADSLNYRLARVFWYASHGNLLHPFVSADQRLTFYPVDGILLYVPLVLYGVTTVLFSIPSLFAWLAMSYVSYRFARALQAERLIALFAAWLVAMTPSILIEASSTNDEILTAVPLVIGLFFAWRWLVTGVEHYFFLAALGAGLCVGTKLHIFFLIPIILMALCWFVWFLWRRKESWRLWLPTVRLPVIFWSVAIFSITGPMFFILNYISTGQFYFFAHIYDQALNNTFSLQDAFQNFVIYVSSIIFAPIADLNFWQSFREREITNVHLNSIFAPLIAPFVDTDPKYFHLKYVFHGVIIPTSVLLVEYGLWPGFAWLLWPVQAIGFLRQTFTLRRFFLMLAATPVIWLVIWSCTTLYMEGVPTYFAFYLMCAAPAMVLCFVRLGTPLANKLRWWTIIFVVATNIIIDGNVGINNTFRGLWHFTEDQPFPYDWLRFQRPVIDEIQRAKKIHIAITHGKVYYFAFMHWNPTAFYYSPYQATPNMPDILHILTTPSEFAYGFMPMKIPFKPTIGVTYLGYIRGVDREAIFAFGNGVHLRHASESDYINLHLSVMQDDRGFSLGVDPMIAGYNPQDNLEFRYTLMTLDKKIVYERPWGSDPVFRTSVPQDPTELHYLINVSIRSGSDYKKMVSETFGIGGTGAWCIQTPGTNTCRPGDDD